MKLNEIFKTINYFITSSPVDVEGLSLALGLKVEKQPLSDNISGMIKKGEGYIIVVNQNQSLARQRFTIAHELGHYIYHRSKIGDGIVDTVLYRQAVYAGISNNEINARDEQQANNFAANLLMPLSLIEEINKKLGKIDPTTLADKLNVSVQAIKIRLSSLGLSAN